MLWKMWTIRRLKRFAGYHYLGVSKKKPGNEALAQQFAEAMVKWKKKPEFKKLKTKFEI